MISPTSLLRAALIAAVFLVGSGRAGADDAQAGVRDAIARQIEAFRRDDAAAAFSFAAPVIQERFATPDLFMQMVREGYAPVYRPRSYRFGPAAARGGTVVQKVEIVGPDGDFWIAIYTLEPGPEGAWRITGCYLTRPPGVGA